MMSPAMTIVSEIKKKCTKTFNGTGQEVQTGHTDEGVTVCNSNLKIVGA